MKVKFTVGLSILLTIFLAIGSQAQTEKEKTLTHEKPAKPTLRNPIEPAQPTIQKPTNPNIRELPTVNPPKPKYTVRQVKKYVVPGARVVAAAKRHGFTFSGEDRCRYNGVNAWNVEPGANRGMYCKMKAFLHTRNTLDCNKLNEGWELVDISFGGEINRHTLFDRSSPAILFSSENDTQGPKMVILESITLRGPSGGPDHYEQAFTRCD